MCSLVHMNHSSKNQLNGVVCALLFGGVRVIIEILHVNVCGLMVYSYDYTDMFQKCVSQLSIMQ